MHRNPDHHAETLVHVADTNQVQRLLDYVYLQMYDGTSFWHEQPDGTCVHDHDERSRRLDNCQHKPLSARLHARSARRPDLTPAHPAAKPSHTAIRPKRGTMPPNTHPDKNSIDAAGAVVFRQQDGTPQVCLVHRPWYDDWSFPKGKQEKDESIACTAVREVGEETGVHIRLGAKISTVTYPLHYDAPQGRHAKSPSSGVTLTKRVAYWIGHPISETADLQRSEALGVPVIRDDETDNVVWLDCQEAAARLTYDDDRAVLARFQELTQAGAADAATVLLTRQAKAESSKRWNAAFDQQRPLSPTGAAEAFRATRDLAAYGVTRLETVPYTRCAETLQPYSAQTGAPILSDILPSDATTPVSDACRTLGDALADAADRPQSPTAVCLRRVDFDDFLRGAFPRFRSPEQDSPEDSEDTVSPCDSLGIKPGMCLALTIVPEPQRMPLPSRGYRILASHVVTERCSES